MCICSRAMSGRSNYMYMEVLLARERDLSSPIMAKGNKNKRHCVSLVNLR